MPISKQMLERGSNRCVVAPCWATLSDWLEILACKPLATPLVDFGREAPYRVGVTTLNWYLLDLFGLRAEWLDGGWNKRSELWLLINPLRYRLLGHQPKRPYPLDVQEYLRREYPEVLNHTLEQHPYFALAPTVYRFDSDDVEVQRLASQAPWNRVAILNEQDDIIGMIWNMGRSEGALPPLMPRARPNSADRNPESNS